MDPLEELQLNADYTDDLGYLLGSTDVPWTLGTQVVHGQEIAPFAGNLCWDEEALPEPGPSNAFGAEGDGQSQWSEHFGSPNQWESHSNTGSLSYESSATSSRRTPASERVDSKARGTLGRMIKDKTLRDLTQLAKPRFQLKLCTTGMFPSSQQNTLHIAVCLKEAYMDTINNSEAEAQDFVRNIPKDVTIPVKTMILGAGSSFRNNIKQGLTKFLEPRNPKAPTAEERNSAYGHLAFVKNQYGFHRAPDDSEIAARVRESIAGFKFLHAFDENGSIRQLMGNPVFKEAVRRCLFSNVKSIGLRGDPFRDEGIPLAILEYIAAGVLFILESRSLSDGEYTPRQFSSKRLQTLQRRVSTNIQETANFDGQIRATTKEWVSEFVTIEIGETTFAGTGGELDLQSVFGAPA